MKRKHLHFFDNNYCWNSRNLSIYIVPSLMSGWGLQRILDVNVPNNVHSFAPLQLFFDVWCDILSCVFLEGCHTNQFDHVDDCCSIQYYAIHSHIIICGFLIEFFKAMQEVWLWSRHQVTIFGNRWRITAILVSKELIEVAISNLTSHVKLREKFTWLLKCFYLHLVWCFVRLRWLGEDCELVFLYYFIDTCFLLF